ncbi:reverse transcriptase domain-containing protein [Tanacetum coccineum]
MNKSNFHWTAEAEEAFKQMKQLIAELPMLTAPMEKEELIVYLAATKETVSAILMTKREAKQMHIYFVSRALRGPELNYTPMEKLVLALVHASKRLKRYFQAHPIIVITDQPIQEVLSRPKVAEEDSPNTPMEVEEELPEPWILFTDGSSCTDGSGAGLILTNPEGMEFTYAIRFRFDATNNEAAYEALIAGLMIAEQMGVKNLQANVDSRLMANQVNETFAKEADMIHYLEKVRTLTNSFKAFSIRQVPRSENKKADALSKIASTRFANLMVKEEGDTWMTPIFKYLEKGTLPADVKKARATGYYWPTMHKDAKTLIRTCQDCQVHKPVPWNPQQKLTPISSPWPFYKCGIDIAGPFPEGPGKTNGLVKRANRSLGEGIKARLDARSNNWMEELPHVLWAHRIMIKSSNEDTSFSLTYGTEAVIPTEIGMPTIKTTEVDLVQNNEALEINLDLLEERRKEAAICEANSKAKMGKYYNSKVQNTSFKPGDLMYRNNDASRAEDTGKLGPKWEGPYEVTEALGKGAYKLRDHDGKQLPRTWNISNLKKCYVHKM